jgi:putative oxidoreductase
MYSLASLLLRATFGGLLAGHGAQKLWGKFDGPGLDGTAGFMEKLGMKPGHQWALMAGASEFGGGALTALGMLHPIGPLMSMAPLAVATLKAHAGKPIWVTSGGAELPVTNIAVALAIGLGGPGRFSLDRALGVKLGRMLVGLAAVGAGVGVAAAVSAPKVMPAPPQFAATGGTR